MTHPPVLASAPEAIDEQDANAVAPVMSLALLDRTLTEILVPAGVVAVYDTIPQSWPVPASKMLEVRDPVG